MVVIQYFRVTAKITIIILETLQIDSWLPVGVSQRYLQVLQISLQEAQVGHQLPAEVGAAASCLRGRGQQFPHVDPDVSSDVAVGAALLMAAFEI